MDVEGYADKLIREATERGEMDPVGAGKPLGQLDNDPGWWIKAFLERETLPERRAELVASVQRRVDAAVAEPDLEQARSMLASANRDVQRWNRETSDEHHLDEMSEIELITRRAQRPAG